MRLLVAISSQCLEQRKVMMSEISWEQQDGEAPGKVSPPIRLPEGFGLVMGSPAAQWVRTPPELGSKKLYIKAARWVDMRCPVEQCGGPIHTVDLEEDISVTCCSNCGKYGWVRTGSLP
jgi:hypothetical protein